MSQPTFHFLRQAFRTIFNGTVFHRAKAATVITVSAKHASTTTATDSAASAESPLLRVKELKVKEEGRNWEWLPLHSQYEAARKTIVLCHGLSSRTFLSMGVLTWACRIIWV
jgi:hypothetical protein